MAERSNLDPKTFESPRDKLAAELSSLTTEDCSDLQAQALRRARERREARDRQESYVDYPAKIERLNKIHQAELAEKQYYKKLAQMREEDNKDLRERADNLDTTLEELTEAFKVLERCHRGALSKREERIAAAQAETKKKQEEIDKFQAEVERLRESRIKGIQAQAKSAGEIDALKKENKELREKLGSGPKN